MTCPRSRCIRPLPLLVVGSLLLVVSVAQAGLGSYHEDERVGYKIRPPRDWSHVAMSADEQWVVAKFISDRTYTYNDKEMGTMDHRPEMTAITFIESVIEKRGAEVSEDEEDGSIFISFNNPYKDYKEFLKRTYSGGGWYVSEEEEDEHKGIPVTRMEIKVEKLTYTGPKRLVTWIYHLEDVDLAVQYEVLENHYDKLKGDLTSSFKSFRTITRTKSLVEETTGKKKWVDEDKLSLEDRTKRRKELEETRHKKNVDSLPDDWEAEKMGRFLVLLHGDKKYAKKVVKQADAMWKWLDKTFPFFGEGEYVPEPIIRICKDRAEEQAFLGGGTTWSSEIVTHRSDSGATSWEFEYVNERMVSIWFQARNSDAWWAAPYWVRNGIRDAIGTARLKGSRIEFEADEWERQSLRESARADELTPPETLVKLKREAFFEQRNRSYQAAAFVRFLLASKNKKCRGVLQAYLEALQDIVAEMKANEEDDVPEDAPKTEAEEEERMKRRSEAFEKKEEEVIQKAFERAFGDWSEKDWRRLTDMYFKTVD